MSTTKVKWPILAIGLAIIVPLVVVLGASFGNNPHYIPSATVGKLAAPFDLFDLDGKRHTLEELRGKVIVLNFWSTWCLPCKIEHPVLQNEPSRYPDVAFLGALYSDTPAKAKMFLATPSPRDPQRRPRTLPYPTLVDPESRLAIDYGVSGVPETYFINREGRIVHKHVAPIDPVVLMGCIEVARVTGEISPAMMAKCDGGGR